MGRVISTPASLRLDLLALVVVSILALVAASCSSSENAADVASETTADIGPDCRAQVDAGQVSPQCEETLFLGGIDPDEFPELESIDQDQLMGFARGLCAYASSLADYSDEQLPMYGDLITSTSNSWGVDPEVVDAVRRSTKQLCPDGYETLGRLRKSNDDGIQVELLVRGEGDADIEYTLPDGSSRTAESGVPWTQMLHMTRAATLSLTATPRADAKVGCQISVNGEVVATERVASEPALCDITEADLDKALSAKVVAGD